MSLRLIQHVTSPVLSCPILSCPLLSCRDLSCRVLSYPVLYCPVLPDPVLPYPVFCPLLSSLLYPTLLYLVLIQISSCFLLTVTQKVDLNYIENLRSTIFPALHIGLALELDSATTVTGSCSFRTGTPGADGSPIAVGVSHGVCQSKCSATSKITEYNLKVLFLSLFLS